MSKFKVGQRVISNNGIEGVIKSIDYKWQNDNIVVNFNGDYEFFKLDGTSYYDSDFKIKSLERNDEYFRKGNTVFCALFGEGVVEDVNEKEDDMFPITVYFESLKDSKLYTKKGKWFTFSNVTLSQKPIQPIINEPLPSVFNLSFTEAMEAVKEGKKVMCERWSKGEYIVLEGSYVIKKQSNMSDYYEIYIDDLKAKWRIIA